MLLGEVLLLCRVICKVRAKQGQHYSKVLTPEESYRYNTCSGDVGAKKATSLRWLCDVSEESPRPVTITRCVISLCLALLFYIIFICLQPSPEPYLC